MAVDPSKLYSLTFGQTDDGTSFEGVIIFRILLYKQKLLYFYTQVLSYTLVVNGRNELFSDSLCNLLLLHSIEGLS